MDKPSGPVSVGIIMDGNRRWAKERGLPTMEGHRVGLQKIKEVAEWAYDAGIREVILYAFSTENWKRSPEEVAYLMDLFVSAFGEWIDDLMKQDVRVRFIGERTRVPAKVVKVMEETETRTAANSKGTLAFAFSYGGRLEILTAVNELLAEGKQLTTEEELREKMWSAGLADPDLIIRTSGEKRLSNFLTWQSVYSELFFTDTKWPAFSKEEFDSILAEFNSRERRLGR